MNASFDEISNPYALIQAEVDEITENEISITTKPYQFSLRNTIDSTQLIDASEVVTLEFEIANTGLLNDSYNIAFLSNNAWVINETTTVTSVAAGQSSSVITFSVEVPSNLALDSSDKINVYVESTTTSQQETLDFDLTVSIPFIEQIISFNPPASMSVGDSPFSISAIGGDSGNPIVFASTTVNVCNVNNTTVTLSNEGTCTIVANQFGNETYDSATQVTKNIVIVDPERLKQVVKRAEISKSIIQKKYGNGFVPYDATGGIFTDVQPGDFNADWIEKLFNDGISEGCKTNNYCPNMVVTKEQLAKIILKAKHGGAYLPPVASDSLFTDVSSASFAVDWIEALSNQNISQGCSATKFCPKEAVTVEGFEKMLEKALP